MARQFRVWFAPEDQARLLRLQDYTEINGALCLVRVCLERCMTRYPGPESITNVFVKQCKAALGDLSAGDVLAGKPHALALGSRYLGYIDEMKGPLGFGHGSKMLRAVLLMFERGDI
jgi:hypothetical protein